MSTRTDVVIIGGGPVGLATAIAARNAGFSVVLADHAVPPIDKACGEGLMPDALAVLERIGVTIPAEKAFPFRGIRFREGSTTVDATFPRGVGYGVRRTVLHDLLTKRAGKAGVELRWGTRVSNIAHDRITLNNDEVSCRWIIGADGQASQIRETMHIGRARTELRRYGFRQHYALKPWTDCVEVYWSDCGQVYVTPVAENQVCVALITENPHLRLSCLPTHFPELDEKLAGASASTREQGAITLTRQLDSVCSGNIALVGEASGSVDAITGEGMSLGFQQALALVEAMKSGSLAPYARAHREISKNARRMAMLMLTMGNARWLRHRALRALSSRPELFAQMLSIHVGETRLRDFGLDNALALGWRMLHTQGEA